MSNYACPICFIVYHRISDFETKKICKKCGRAVVYWNEDYVKEFVHDKVRHDFRWSSGRTDPEYIDPNYTPE